MNIRRKEHATVVARYCCPHTSKAHSSIDSPPPPLRPPLSCVRPSAVHPRQLIGPLVRRDSPRSTRGLSEVSFLCHAPESRHYFPFRTVRSVFRPQLPAPVPACLRPPAPPDLCPFLSDVAPVLSCLAQCTN